MAIDVLNEQVLTIGQAGKEIIFGGRRTHPSSWWRRIREGVKTRSGHRVHLEGVRIGREICTSREAISRFFKALAEADQLPAAQSSPQPTIKICKRSPEDRQAAIAKASARLAASGV